MRNNKIPELIISIENRIEEALHSLEMHEDIEQALTVYRSAESELNTLELSPEDPNYPEQQRVLAYCLLRQGNILRQLGEAEAAMAVSEREIAAARASQDKIMLARCQMSNGTNFIVAGDMDAGLRLLDEARVLFEQGDSYDHQQGLGWYWILQADLINAGLIEQDPSAVVVIADRALEILKPIENWPGVARAYAARAKANENLGNEVEAEKDRQQQEHYQSRIVPE